MLWPYALCTVQQAKEVCVIQDDGKDALIEACVNEASQMVENAWGRHIVSRGALTEYHPKDICSPLGIELYTNEWPVVTVTTVHEDAARVYSTPLVVSTDYLISKPVGKLIRVSSALPICWLSSWRAVKLVYVAGYQVVTGTQLAGAVAVPDGIKRVLFELVAWMFKQRTAGEVGMSQVQDGFGNRTFSGPAYITPAMQTTLYAAGAVMTSLRGRTGERDE